MSGALAGFIGVIHSALRRVAQMGRLMWYQAFVFVWYQPLPVSTRIYGRLTLPYVPCRIRMGPRCGFGDGVTLSTGRQAVIEMGSDVTLNTGCLVVASQRIRIGDRVAAGEYVSIRDQQHLHVPGKGVRDQGFKVSPVEIGDNTWIGRGAFIGPGTSIGRNCIVGANSVVHGIFPDDVLIAGAPAVIKRQLDRTLERPS